MRKAFFEVLTSVVTLTQNTHKQILTELRVLHHFIGKVCNWNWYLFNSKMTLLTF